MCAASLKRFDSSQTRTCQHCKKSYNVKGISAHEKSCGRKLEALRKDLEYEKSLRKNLKEISRLGSGTNSMSSRSIYLNSLDDTSTVERYEDLSGIAASHEHVPHLVPLSEAGFSSNIQSPSDPSEEMINADFDNNTELRMDDIRTEYHPYSGRATELSHFEDYRPFKTVPQSRLPDEAPWRPFRTRADFDFAEVAFKAALTEHQVKVLIDLINGVASGEKKFTFNNVKDLNETWTRASQLLTPFEKKTFTVPYNGEKREFDMYYRPLWDWTLDLLNDEQLAPHFVWDARRLSKYDGNSFVQFFHEPWTGSRFWDIQSSLKPGGSPLAYIIYCDKSNLSSFGTQKGYPVVARIANLPVEIRNGDGVGGGRVVGWLPTEFEDVEEEGKTPYTDFKRVVWHDAMGILLESIKDLSKVGFHFLCADGKKRRLHPCILILSADYEEQCVMALTRGSNAKASCPVCLVPSLEIFDLSKTFPMRDVETHKKDIDLKTYATVAAREEKLKDLGLRPVKNVFWNIENSDPYQALCWDRLHAYHGGLFGHHIWKEIREEASALGRWAVAQINEQFNMFPRWRGLYHTDKVMSVTFSDGSKLEDISKQLLYAAHNVLEASESGYLLLCCLRSYLVLDTYLSLEVHTSETLEAGERELLTFSTSVQEYVESLEEDNWTFPKMHSQRHAFDDIRAKGVTRNYNTKINEKLHGPIKDSYHLRTNFRDVAKQILKADQTCFVSLLIRSYIDEYDNYQRNLAEAEKEENPNIPPKSNAAVFPSTLHYVLGSVQPAISLAQLELEHIDDIAFIDFDKKLSSFMTDFLPEFGIDLPTNIKYPIRLLSHEKLVPYRYLKVHYESKVTWRQDTDYLRCNPDFHGKPRYDHVILQAVDKQIFAQLIYVFSFTIGKIKYPLALVQPFDAPIDQTPKDKDLGLFRVRAQPRANSEIYPVASILRGALLMKDYSDEWDDQYLIVDIIDGDMFLRMKEMVL